jgi:hypothetical protein
MLAHLCRGDAWQHGRSTGLRPFGGNAKVGGILESKVCANLSLIFLCQSHRAWELDWKALPLRYCVGFTIRARLHEQSSPQCLMLLPGNDSSKLLFGTIEATRTNTTSATSVTPYSLSVNFWTISRSSLPIARRFASPLFKHIAASTLPMRGGDTPYPDQPYRPYWHTLQEPSCPRSR